MLYQRSKTYVGRWLVIIYCYQKDVIRRRLVMRLVLWVLQALLAAMFVWHGLLYVAPPAEMAEMMNSMIAPGFRMFIGAAELLAAVGLILPAATRILPWLTP
jgi:uncharacterized membrane protein YphA (DoxX/SURF4 family)